MRRTDLELVILDYMKHLYKAEYIGRLEVEQTDTSYTLLIGIPSYMAPTYITCACDKDVDFLDYVQEELRTRNYMRLDIYKTIRYEKR